ncbi:response regulator [Dyadobacter chenhuakuii]|uniref:Response regulator transcription factor n=1 Tax=Dyadobacter chenhuakuii TaxID=2909339 RepID=A0ABY4XLY0_9BACT|nr:response regulator transcription factor [Dyadobacter chenhuakuii]MCF2494133.1 response regulator transcription factor [Dyadobacter chenhuakuii]USJ31261.1 response regulator transcription factor [Dyadobacter chenhuakuii]
MKVFIIDDHPIVLDGLRNLLESREEMEVSGMYQTGSAVLDALETTVPDAMLMDINLPDINGVTLCQKIKQKFPAAKIIALSVHNERTVIMGMLQSGASGYVLKNAIGKDIITALHAAMDGQIYLCQGTQAVLNSSPPSDQKEIPRLTRREKEILQLIGTGHTTQQIAAALFISTHTVESHRKNLIEKFGAPNTATVIKIATDLGLT